jgi:hypothetical protein
MYSYQTEKPALFTEGGQRDFLKTRDHVHALLKKAGAFRMQEAMICSVCSWTQLAMIDRLVELGEIREITGGNVAGQHRVFVAAN